MGTFGAAGKMLGGGVMWLLIASAFLLMGAAVAGIEKRSYFKSLVALFFGGIAGAIAFAFLRVFPVIGHAVAGVGAFVISLLVTKNIFETTFAKALVAVLVAWVLAWLVAGGAWLVLVVLLGIALL